jgi:tetratricopeptide (TPR) repeat protein
MRDSNQPESAPLRQEHADNSSLSVEPEAGKPHLVPCPFCSEQIQPTARKCRHCGEWMQQVPGPAAKLRAWSAVTLHPQASKPVVIYASGLFAAFFMPWVQLFGFGMSGYNLGQLGSYGNYSWIIPLLAGATILVSLLGANNRVLGAISGIVPLGALLYGVLRLSSGGGAQVTRGVLEIAQHVLSIGAYLTIIFSVALITAAFRQGSAIVVGMIALFMYSALHIAPSRTSSGTILSRSTPARDDTASKLQRGGIAFNEGNSLYRAQDYRAAAAKYEEALAADRSIGSRGAYFLLGNSYDNMSQRSRRGDAADSMLLTKAVDNYNKAAELDQDPKHRQLALQYLVAAYGTNKLNEPTKAGALLQKMIREDPSDLGNYFQLAQLYENSGAYDAAEQVLTRAKDAKPSDPRVYTTLAGYYNRRQQFGKTIDTLEQRTAKEPNNPELYYTISTLYWHKVSRDALLSDAEKKSFVAKGIQAVDHALQIKPDFAEALIYKGLLLRLQANLENDLGKQQVLLKEADRLRDKAQQLKNLSGLTR